MIPDLPASASDRAVAAWMQDYAHGSAPSPTVRSTPMQLRFSVAGLTGAGSTGRRSTRGMSTASTGDPGVDRWIASWRDSHARTSARQAAARVWRESGAAFSSRSCAWPQKSSPISYSLRTSGPESENGSPPLNAKWPASGMISDGTLYPLRNAGLHNFASGGSRWPLVTAAAGRGVGNQGRQGGLNLQTAANRWASIRATDEAKGGPNQKFGAGGEPLPAQAARCAALTARDWRSIHASETTHARNARPLSEQVGEFCRAHPDLMTSKGGASTSGATLVLNPRFCEVLMGWPVGLLKSVSQATASTPRRRRKRGGA